MHCLLDFLKGRNYTQILLKQVFIFYLPLLPLLSQFSGLWFRNTVPRLFNKCRIPRRNRDELKVAPPSSPHSSKIVLLIRDWMYAVDVYDGKSSNIGHQELERRLRSVVADVNKRESRGERPFAVGLLSSDGRDKWAEVRFLKSTTPSQRD